MVGGSSLGRGRARAGGGVVSAEGLEKGEEQGPSGREGGWMGNGEGRGQIRCGRGTGKRVGL